MRRTEFAVLREDIRLFSDIFDGKEAGYQKNYQKYQKKVDFLLDSHTVAGIMMVSSSRKPAKGGTANAKDWRIFKAVQSQRQDASPL